MSRRGRVAVGPFVLGLSCLSPFNWLFFSIFFSGGVNPRLFLMLRCGSGCQIKAQAPARVGRSGTSDGCFTAPEEGAGRTPQLLSKGNIVLIRNRKRASLLCVCSAVLIYLDLRWNSEILFTSLSCPDLPWHWKYLTLDEILKSIVEWPGVAGEGGGEPLAPAFCVEPSLRIRISSKVEVNQDSWARAKMEGSLSTAYYHNISFAMQLGGTSSAFSGVF